MTVPSLPPVDASLPVDAPVPLVKKRYARSRHQDTAVINSGPDSIYRFGSVRSSNFDDVLTSEVPGPRTRLANVKLNLLTQTRTAAKDSGLYGPIDSAELQLSNFRGGGCHESETGGWELAVCGVKQLPQAWAQVNWVCAAG